ncbi:MAG TPA: histidine phosphatase family protein [Steroidobacteraceae bacterium]|jgi:broad specificity phosphatase PhoE|nr:histidine phosphatase family protein [Steroidobacteraceae bacterium]
MTNHYASLQRRPFLTPVWLSVLGALVVMGMLGYAAWVWGTADSTTIIVVRHAEKEPDAGEDPPLTQAGEARAVLLARMFGDSRTTGRIDAIYVSPALRNRTTAAPLAAKLGLQPIVVPARDVRGLTRRVLREHSGGRILVIGHSDTVPDIVESLTGAKHLPPIGPDEYSTMYIVTVPSVGRAEFLRLTY